MLKVKAEIQFTREGKTYAGDEKGIKLRPAFNFGNDMLFSGAIKSGYTTYVANQKYVVDIDFFTIDKGVFDSVQPLLVIGRDIAIQEGKRIIGIASF